MFDRDGDAFLPRPITAGPWDPGALHAGPVSALMGRILSEAASGERWLARITVELLRPVPLGPLAATTSVIRPGRRVETLACTLSAGGKDVARAEALFISIEDVDLSDSDHRNPPRSDVTPPEQLESYALRFSDRLTFGHAVELRLATGTPFTELGPAAVWFRLLVPTFADSEITPLDRALTTSDFPNGTSNVLEMDHWTFINPDLVVLLHRLPADEWVLLDAESHVRSGGYGAAIATLHDRRGPLGTAQQTLVIAPR